MSVGVKVDEDLPVQMAELFIAHGYDAKTVVGQGWRGVADDVLWQRIQTEGRWLVTGDKGFADLRSHPPGSHSGVLLLRPQEESRRAYLELLEAALEQLDLDHSSGSVAVVTHRGLRIRRPSKQ